MTAGISRKYNCNNIVTTTAKTYRLDEEEVGVQYEIEINELSTAS
jgi:hypothetical protein